MHRLVAARPSTILALLVAVLLAGVFSPSESDPATDYKSRMRAILTAQQTELALLAELHTRTHDAEESERLQREIDLVKRTAELRILELQESELRRLGDETARARLLPLIESCRADLAKRQVRYGMPLPALDTGGE